MRLPLRIHSPARVGRAPSLVAVLALCCLSATASALDIHCVDSAAELDAALRASQEQNVRINLAQGSYDLEGTALDADSIFHSQEDVTLVGGYSDGNCTARSVDPALTVLFGDGSTQFNMGNILIHRSVALRSLTLRDVFRADIFGREHDLSLERVRFERTGNVSLIARHVRISESVFTDNQTPTACALSFVTGLLSESIRVESSLVTRSAGRGLCINESADLEDWGVATIENSILWGNQGDDLVVASPINPNDLALRNNLIGTQNVAPASTIAPVATSNANPLFVDPANGDFRLQIASPAKDSGSEALSSGLPAQDIEGLPRVVAGTIDRGPHENQNAALQFNYTVSTGANSGAGSLRQALLDAEANPGLNGIVFAIPGACPRTVSVSTPLPEITQDLVIDGASQSGSVAGQDELRFDATVCVVLVASPGLTPSNGLVVAENAPPDAKVVINGLAFSSFDGAAIDLRGGGGHVVTGNQFGGSLSGNGMGPNDYAVRVSRTASPALLGTQIGGPQPRQRNLLGGSQVAGVALVGSFVRDTRVIGNFIGLAANGSGALANQYGVLNTGAIDTTLTDNWIGGNTSDGVYLNTSRSYLQGNHIGLRAVPTGLNDNRGNFGWGVRIASTQGELSGNVVGSGVTTIYGVPAPVGAGNVIAWNTAGGIRTDIGLGHRLSRNLVYSNTNAQIDVGAAGPDSEDNDSAAGATALPNRGLNAPVVQFVSGGADEGRVLGYLRSRAGQYRIEIYSDTQCSAGNPPRAAARVLHGAGLVEIEATAPGQDELVEFDFALRSNSQVPALVENRGIVALAIDEDGNTSELSACAGYRFDNYIFADGFESD